MTPGREVLSADPRALLTPLFARAKEVDEFEFCCALLRIRGTEAAGWDPLRESFTLAQQLIGVIQAPIEPKFRLRLSLFLYCHLTEVDDLYKVPANLLRVVSGERCSMTPFEHLPKAGKLPPGAPSNERIEQLAALSQQAGFAEIGSLFRAMFLRQVRNAFFHSDYVLTDDSFNIRHGEGVKIGDVIQPKVAVEWLMQRVNLGITTALDTIELIREGLWSYKANRVIRGRLSHDGGWVHVELLTDPRVGLIGFRTTAASLT